MAKQGKVAARVAIDWGDRKHAVTLQEEGSSERQRLELEHRPATIREWVQGLKQRYGGRPVAVVLEQSRGGLLHALIDYDFLVLYPINPKALARYREACRLSGAKDDLSDSELLLELLLARESQLRAWYPEAVEVRALRQLVRYRSGLVQDAVQLSNRLTSVLKEYFPQVLEWFGKANCRALWDFVQRWPDLEAAQRTRPGTLEEFFGKLGRRGTVERASAVREAVALTRDPAVLAVHPVMAQQLARRLRQLNGMIRAVDKQIAERFEAHPDAHLFESFPGAGKVCAPRLLVAFGSDRDRFDSQQMRHYVGTAPVTVGSGRRLEVRMRRACNHFLRQSLHDFAELSMRKSQWARAFYRIRRQRGLSHHSAVRALADRWVRVITACWKHRVPYREEHYLMALQRKRSPVIQWLYHSASRQQPLSA